MLCWTVKAPSVEYSGINFKWFANRVNLTENFLSTAIQNLESQGLILRTQYHECQNKVKARTAIQKTKYTFVKTAVFSDSSDR